MINIKNDLIIKTLNQFKVNVNYNEKIYISQDDHDPSHIHEECEIYVNVSGNAFFVCENNIYPVSKGNAVITRPYEYHFCIYPNNLMHKYYCIWFHAPENNEIFDIFFKRKRGENNLISLSEKDSAYLLEICKNMTVKPKSTLDSCTDFFNMMSLLYRGTESSNAEISLPSDIEDALNYIDNNFNMKISVYDIASNAHVSVNTLERHFKEYLNSSPLSYLNKKKLSNAAKLLNQGSTVSDACFKSGFSDYSGFIAKFRNMFNVTPLQYKKGRNER